MSRLTATLGAALFLALIPAGSGARDKCFDCHVALGDKASALFAVDVHRSKGVTCAGCHGGNAAAEEMDVAMDKNRGFLGVPRGDEISTRCATCHGDSARMGELGSSLRTDQLAVLAASVHGRTALSGTERIVQCTTCHGAHGIRATADPASPVYPLNVVTTCARCHSDAAFIAAYNPSLAVDQLEKYRTSKHGIRNQRGDPRTAECASCHGSHDILPVSDVRSRVYPTNVPTTCARCHSDATVMHGYGIPTDQYEKFAQSVHGVALLKRNDLGAPACNKCHGNHGATPPGVESISKVCGTCHALNAELFGASPHKAAFDTQRLPECETCHGNHEIIAATKELIGTHEDAVCARCHSAEKAPEGFRSAAIMAALIDSLEASEAHADLLVRDAEQKGMEIGEMRFRLRDARQARLEARTAVHAFDLGKFREVIAKGLTVSAGVTADAEAAVEEYHFRRVGLGVSTLVISLLAISLYVYIRRLERRQRNGAPVPNSHHTH